MAEAKKLDAAKLAKLLAVGKDLHGKLGAVLEEIDEVIGGGAGIASQIKMFEAGFDAVWCERYARGQTGRYVWRFSSDVPQIKRLLKMLGLDELKGRVIRYIANDDPFLVRARHPFGLFVSGINSYAGEGQAPAPLELEAEAPIDCRHTPRCSSEQAHTRRRSAEMRS